MINGTVVNNGTNNGSQAGVVVTGGHFGFFGPAINGTVFNNGVNNGSQAGVLIQGGYFGGFFPLLRAR